ncbi:MAG: hypothetical protein HFG35_02975 [Eubacterium sp.]|jgi:hypothetical protein|nr:hypothetical protein [Eubacterium sp.]
MFKLEYRIVLSDDDDFEGQNGFLQIKCNDYKYGEMYPKELETVMDKVSLFDWFERLIKVVKYLMTEDYVVLSDVESYNIWIEFQKSSEEVMISVVKAKKELGTQDIEFILGEPVEREWTVSQISYNQLKMEVVNKASEYIAYVVANNKSSSIDKIKEELEEILL